MMTYFSDLLNDITKGIGGNMKIFSDFAKTFTKNAENDWR